MTIEEEVMNCGLESKRNGLVTSMFTCRVLVNRNSMPEEALKATGRELRDLDERIKTFPKNERGGERREDGTVKVYFFNVGHWIADRGLEKEYKSRNLIPADLYELAAVNIAESEFTAENRTATHWRTSEYGPYCHIAFYKRDDKLCVSAYEADKIASDVWDSSEWLFAGIRPW